MRYRTALFGAAVTAALVLLGSFAHAQATKVGELKSVVAWVNKMPGGPPSLHIVGSITAPTPCYDAIVEYKGETTSTPKTYQIIVKLQSKPGVCIQVLSDIGFHYVQPNYSGNADSAQATSDNDAKTAPIGTAS